MSQRETILTGLLIVVLILLLIVALQPALPRCQEDAVLVGIGDFEDGWWEEYECGPALDDFQGDWVRASR